MYNGNCHLQESLEGELQINNKWKNKKTLLPISVSTSRKSFLGNFLPASIRWSMNVTGQSVRTFEQEYVSFYLQVCQLCQLLYVFIHTPLVKYLK